MAHTLHWFCSKVPGLLVPNLASRSWSSARRVGAPPPPLWFRPEVLRMQGTQDRGHTLKSTPGFVWLLHTLTFVPGQLPGELVSIFPAIGSVPKCLGAGDPTLPSVSGHLPGGSVSYPPLVGSGGRCQGCRETILTLVSGHRPERPHQQITIIPRTGGEPIATSGFSRTCPCPVFLKAHGHPQFWSGRLGLWKQGSSTLPNCH